MSDKTLEQLIDSLKTEAIDQAEKESAKILEEANARAQKVLSAAEEQRASMFKEAEKEAQEIVEKGKSALQVAARDLSLSLRNQILKLLRTTFEAEVRASFKADLMKSVISKVIDNLGSDVEIKLSDKLMEELASYVHQRVQASDNSVSITKDDSQAEGLSITKKDQGWSYDISPSQVTEALLPHLNDHWIKILKDEPPA